MNALSNITINQLAELTPAAFAQGAHSSRSPRYAYIPTAEIIETMHSKGWEVTAAKQSKARLVEKQGHTKHMIRLARPGAALLNGEARAEAVLINSHDGSSGYKVFGGLFRFFCFNGLMISEGRIESVSIPHSGADIMARVIDGTYRVLDDVERVANVVDQWRKITLSLGQQLDFAARAKALRFDRDDNGNYATAIEPHQINQARRGADAMPTLWHTFNRVQENLTKGGLDDIRRIDQPEQCGRIKWRHLRSRPINGIDQSRDLNQGLWELAEQFAQAA